ncbi:MAG: hypothetical protein EA390_06005 [Balneolaceae bacterium]|nr:MAG: hypothetical protein EA390_06005 [Balneolaceae bacterium]
MLKFSNSKKIVKFRTVTCIANSKNTFHFNFLIPVLSFSFMAPIHQQYLAVLTFLLQWAYLFGDSDGGDDTFHFTGEW